MLNKIKKAFQKEEQTDAQPLHIEGVAPAPITPEPDEAEVAAQALLESMSQQKKEKKEEKPEEGTAAYYEGLADRIRQAHDAATLRVMRFVAYCEQQLRKPNVPATGKDSLALMEVELYKRIDTVEREGGELKKRWQRCLAEIIVRQMKAIQAESIEEPDNE